MVVPLNHLHVHLIKENNNKNDKGGNVSTQ